VKPHKPPVHEGMITSNNIRLRDVISFDVWYGCGPLAAPACCIGSALSAPHEKAISVEPLGDKVVCASLIDCAGFDISNKTPEACVTVYLAWHQTSFNIKWALAFSISNNELDFKVW
jgi:hypothetical protein